VGPTAPRYVSPVIPVGDEDAYPGDHVLGDVEVPPAPAYEPGDAHEGEAEPAGAQRNGREQTAGERRDRVQDFLKQRRGAVECCGHDELLDANLPPLPWLVDGMVPDEGLTMLGGKKKLGKSWLCLQFAQAVALGINTLGRPTVQGAVIYVCLEDGKRRLRQRLEKQQAPRGLGITYYTRFPALDGDGMGRLWELLEDCRPRLLIIDTLAAAKTGKTQENEAGPMADISNTLRLLAQHYKLGVLVTHHHGKGVGGDPGDDLRGSSALAAAADVNLGLYREEGAYLLRGEGRDIEEFSLRLSFDRVSTWCWQILGDAREMAQTEADESILDALRTLGEADAATVAEAVGKSRSKVGERLHRLAGGGALICRTESGGKGRPRILFRLVG
jgi:hypothetical protein